MELDIIKTQTTWNDASASINDNFEKLRLAAEQGGSSVEVDSAMSDTSENAVANKVIKKYIDDANVYLEGYAEEVADDALTAAKAYAAPFYINVGMEFPLNEDTHGTLDIATIGVDYTSVVVAYEEGRDIVLNESNGRRHICTDFFPNQVEGIATFTLRAYSYMSGVLRTMLLMFSEGGTGVFWNTKCTPVQEELVSGENIATINGFSLLQGTNIVIRTEQIEVDDALDAQSENPVQNAIVTAALESKQPTLVSGENIATVNGQSLLEGGNIVIEGGGGGSGEVDMEMSDTSENAVANRVIKEYVDALVPSEYNASFSRSFTN